MKRIDTSFILQEPAEEYHGKAKEYLSSHRLADFRKDPLLFHKKELGLVEDPDRPAYVIGRAAHTLILEGRPVFEKEYAVGGPVNPKTGEVYGSRTKAYQEWAEEQGRPVLTDDQMHLVENLRDSVHSHGHAQELLAEGIPEGVGRANYCGVPSQIRIDWLNPERGIVDLKTCDNIDWLQMDAKTYGYAHQLAFYRAVLAAVTQTVAEVYLIAVEKREPFRSGVWRMAPDVLNHAQKENEQAIERLKRCREADAWPTGYEQIRTFDCL
jgi:hypothetical protein